MSVRALAGLCYCGVVRVIRKCLSNFSRFRVWQGGVGGVIVWSRFKNSVHSFVALVVVLRQEVISTP